VSLEARPPVKKHFVLRVNIVNLSTTLNHLHDTFGGDQFSILSKRSFFLPEAWIIATLDKQSNDFSLFMLGTFQVKSQNREPIIGDASKVTTVRFKHQNYLFIQTVDSRCLQSRLIKSKGRQADAQQVLWGMPGAKLVAQTAFQVKRAVLVIKFHNRGKEGDQSRV